ncbi:hypothetical protein BHU72_14205 [Desulfuribacillus stibiiarsenatis]|uniref:Methyltransferase domain-containing protein n=1 Tax=Desulfuribacillus stibiiarsenatis TaxID=1390249 RepID=A0A1E5L894_9FIRM|nr:class I SAM-dependent methyltransferase [Desulfuribacillus stibiiarsenatis]OEH86370.1 hypothetical protein BHU72_14205 [Desulfuribacillus stibiiarsenatis]
MGQDRKFNDSKAHKLTTEERKHLIEPDRILQLAGLKAGASVLDLGAGPGFFAIPAAEIVGSSGQVLAVDISDKMISMLQDEIASKGISNIQVLQQDIQEEQNQGKEFDFIIASLVAHEVEDIPSFLSNWMKSLKTGGKIFILEWQKKEMSYGPPINHRLDPQYLQSVFNEQRIHAVQLHEWKDYFYYVVATKN